MMYTIRSRGLVVLTSVIALALWSAPGSGAQISFGDEQPAKYELPRNSKLWTSGDDVARQVREGAPAYETATLEAPIPNASIPGASSPAPVSLRDVLRSPGESCWTSKDATDYDSDGYGDPPRPDNFRSLISDAAAVLEGTVTGLEGGYYKGIYGGPGLLVQVEVKRWYRAEPEYPREDVVHFFYPRGRFVLGPARVCADRPGWPTPPRVGAAVLLFPALLPEDPRFVRIRGLTGEVAFENEGELVAPQSLRQTIPEFRALRIDDLRRQVRRVLR